MCVYVSKYVCMFIYVLHIHMCVYVYVCMYVCMYLVSVSTAFSVLLISFSEAAYCGKGGKARSPDVPFHLWL